MNMQIKEFFKKYLFTLKINTVSRIVSTKELKEQFKRLKRGVVLDTGSKFAPYKEQIPHTKYMNLDIDPGVKPDIISDIHKVKWQSNYFDTIIATEILEHCYSPEKAINEIHKLLKREGVCILSTRFIYIYHPDPNDYYRFTEDALKYLFKEFSQVEIYPHGDRLKVLWEIINPGYNKTRIFLNILNPLIARFRDSKNTRYPLGFVVYAKK